mgnify:CR=1 FL=1
MKKTFLIFILVVIFITGCGKTSSSKAVEEFDKKINNLKSYYVEGVMELINNEDIYTYNVKVSYKKNDYYKIDLVNTTNNHEQVILRNDTGIYVITPSLNKSFKFQSDWPYNNSQVYLLTSLLDDINNTDNISMKEVDNKYVLTSNVNYPNNDKLTSQEIYMDKNYNVKEVRVLDKGGNVEIKMTFDKIDYSPKFKDNYFDLNQIIEEKNIGSNTDNKDNKTEQTKSTATIDDIVYPMYLPTNTYLTSQEKVSTSTGERLILTFDGDNPFILVEEVSKANDEHVIVPTFGELELLADSVAIVNNNSVNWYSNGIEYYLASNTMKTGEILEIVRSISVLPVANLK